MTAMGPVARTRADSRTICRLGGLGIAPMRLKSLLQLSAQ